MLRKLAIALVAAVPAAAIATGAMAAHSGGGGGRSGGGGGGGHSYSGGGGLGGGHSYSGGSGYSGRGTPSGNMSMSRGVSTPNRSVTAQPFVGRSVQSSTPFMARHVSSDHRFAMIGHRRVHGRHLHGFIPGIGFAYYWYYDDCWVLTDDYGWVNICGYNY